MAVMAWEAVVAELRRERLLHIFSETFLQTVNKAASHESFIEVEVFPEPVKLPQFYSPVIAVAVWRDR